MATELAHPADYSPSSGAIGALLNSIPGRLTAILTVLLLMAQTLPAAKFFANPAHYLPLHIVLEFIAIMISGMVAGLAWNLRERQPNSHRMILGAGFLAVCWIDVVHTLSYAGMPDLVTASGPEKAINFWLAGRLTAAATLLAIALSAPRHWSATVYRLAMATALGVIGVVVWIGLFHAEWLPRTFIAGRGLTPFKVNAEYVLAAAYGTAGLLFLRHARRSGNPDWLWLAGAACIQGLAEMFFTLYADVTDFFNLLGHIYKAVAYFMVYRALFVSGVRAPYRELDAERDRLRESEYKLAQHRDRLEQLVLDRTQELSTKNLTLEETLARLRQAQDELVQASKLASLGKLVAGVAHELNTPIGNARTVASALRDQSAEFRHKLETA
ncbi:MAG TPA: MASE3 domain-containing protein, partial [Rhodocyclaceae bacterium]|nr:MASE3 domain-containing protein [Rhodocyclaceae bacterium]